VITMPWVGQIPGDVAPVVERPVHRCVEIGPVRTGLVMRGPAPGVPRVVADLGPEHCVEEVA